MSNVVDFNVTNEDVKHLCDFMGIDAVRHSDVSYSWKDGVHYMTREDDYYKCMSNIWRYVGERKVYDWNWLMAVVEKIESIRFNTKSSNTEGFSSVEFNICTWGVEVIHHGDYSDTLFCIKYKEIGNSKMEVVYMCCVSFVNWYNANVK